MTSTPSQEAWGPPLAERLSFLARQRRATKMKKFIKSKQGQQLGFRTPDFIKGKIVAGPKAPPKFNPGAFRIQHKG